jgi:hypothetical protein
VSTRAGPPTRMATATPTDMTAIDRDMMMICPHPLPRLLWPLTPCRRIMS